MEKKGLIWGIVLIAISVICYFCFLKKDNSSEVENNNVQNSNLTMQEITISPDSQKILLGDSEITIKEDNDSIYINGQLNNQLSGIQKAYKINDLLFFLGAAQCNYALYVVDKTGNVVNGSFLYQFSNLQIEENRIIAYGAECPCLDEGACPDGNVKVEFVYNGTNVTMNVLEKNIH